MKSAFIIIVFAVAIISVLASLSFQYTIQVKQIRQSLKSQSTETVFTQEMIADLPEPVQRYFQHAIASGTSLPNCVELKMSGHFRLKPDADWMPMEASQIISTLPGFVWQGKVGRGLIRFSGADYFHDGKGRMKFSAWGLIPLVDARNENINRSGIGRLAGEYALWLPSALLPQNGVTWKAVSEKTIQANLKLNDEPITLTLTIDADGKLLKMSLSRWGNFTEDSSWQYIPFGGEVAAEKTYEGHTIPSAIDAGWWFDSKNYFEFFKVVIEKAQFY